MKTLICNGTVVSSAGLQTADILIEDEKIIKVGDCSGISPDVIISAQGKLIFPGFIDAHTHFDLDVCNTTTADDFSSGTTAAICGGTTSIIDFACPNKGESLHYGLKLWHEKAQKNGCSCDYGFHMTIDDWNPDIQKELPEMFQKGISSFKMYMTYPAMMLGDRDLFQVLAALKKLGGIAGIHCENSGVIDALTENAKQTGNPGPAAHPKVRPSILEAEAVSRLLKMAKLADTPVTIVHLSSEESLQEVRRARESGQTVFVETCPQYLLLDDSNYDKSGIAGASYVCAPPLRKSKDINALWAAIHSGEIQTVSTDHCSFTLQQKAAGSDDFTKIPGGLPGVETRGLLLFGEGVMKKKITAEDMCRVLCENPARIYGLYPRKGVITAGSDADLVIIDPNQKQTLSIRKLHGNCDYTPYEGLEIYGIISDVFLRGARVYTDSELKLPGLGKFLHRNQYEMPI